MSAASLHVERALGVQLQFVAQNETGAIVGYVLAAMCFHAAHFVLPRRP